MALTLDTPIIELSRHGISKLSADAARKLAVAVAPLAGRSRVDDATVADLLDQYPSRYEDRSNFIPIDQLEDGMEAAVEVVVRTAAGIQVGKMRDRRKPPLFVFEISGGDRTNRMRPVTVKWFISGKAGREIVKWYTEKFTRGTRFVAFGTWERDKRGQMVLKLARPEEIEVLPPIEDSLFYAPRSEDPADDNASDPSMTSVHMGRVPIYRKLGPFETKRLREIVKAVLNALEKTAVDDEPLPRELLERCDLITRREAIAEIHFPPADADMADYEAAKSPAHRRLIFDEFFWLAFAMRVIKGARQKEPKGANIEINDVVRERLHSLLPFTLTAAQKRVVGEIFADLKGDAPMNRLIQGDVGSGKTIVAFLAILAALDNGYQAALMAPTEILAEQHYRNAERLFASSGHRVELLTGSLRSAAKKAAVAAIAAGDVDLVIGTHAVIQDAVTFDRLGLAVIDEQHRFGVLQRQRLKELGENPDILVMTATPIPRSLAMTVYGDLDVSVIDELPPGRTPIKTIVCGEDQRSGVYKGIEREIALGRQAYVVYPLIAESAKLDLKAATAMYDDLKDRVFPNRRIGLLHGKMKPAEKDATMTAFAAGEIDILVSTTVIEVGIDVPNASLMVIEHAERFGLSQLHQLRGRVGRGTDQSYCVLLADFKRTAAAKERLGVMEESSDGFVIAEKDLELRGQGELLGTRQSGLQSFRLANIVRDLEVLALARREVEFYMDRSAGSRETKRLMELALTYKNVGLAEIV